jgi:cytochrome c oxidase assembly protein subunit 15
MLTGVLGLIALAAFITVLLINRQRVSAGLVKRGHLTKLAVAVVLGILAQAVLGGITVLTGLNPLTVSAHFLVSMILIAVSVALLVRANEPDDAVENIVAKPVRYLVQTITALTLVIIVLGTLVTGTGPHAGDTAEVPRLNIDPVTITHVHATAVQLFFGLIIGLIVAVLANNSPRIFLKRSLIVLTVALGQGAIGYIQYFTGLPWVLVAAHVLGACLLWISVLYVHALTVQPKSAATSPANV